jgi:hypothetical protein
LPQFAAVFCWAFLTLFSNHYYRHERAIHLSNQLPDPFFSLSYCQILPLKHCLRMALC